jgi:transcriptional regulator with XRE-family HTH domain
MMVDSASPLMIRRRLRTELRAARLNKDLTQEQVANAMDWSLSKMNRIEKAKSSISVNDLRVLLPLYGITDKEQTDELISLAREARQTPWWRGYSAIAPTELLELMDSESAASVISQFETTFVPGILQTEEFAAAVLQVFYEEKTAEERKGLVDLRTRRRSLLTSDDAPNFTFVLDEPVVSRLVGGPAVMSRQLHHIIDMADLPNVTVRVVPLAAGAYPGMKGAFEVVQFDDAPEETIVFVENPSGDSIVEGVQAGKEYLQTFERIAEASLSPADSVVLVREIADKMA